ncbi:ro-7-like protein [Purpureocillium lavendulum]|uniref:Ro-7-like protein n=1 Tax=Purpureocillium lavendulum TaxID=1247861 RepID=A0AB34FPN4_9HYPO|nr:ro-7-like protein [Purpureocillium lavendulum]
MSAPTPVTAPVTAPAAATATNTGTAMAPAQQQQQQQPVNVPLQPRPDNRWTRKAVGALFWSNRRESTRSIGRLGVPMADRVIPISQAIDAARYGAPGVHYTREGDSDPLPGPERPRRVFERPGTRFVVDTVFPFEARHRPLYCATATTWTALNAATRSAAIATREASVDATTRTTPRTTIKNRHQHKEAYRKATTQVNLTIRKPTQRVPRQPAVESDSDSDDDESISTIAPASLLPNTVPPSAAAPLVAIEPIGPPEQVTFHHIAQSAAPASQTAQPVSATPGEESSAQAVFHFGQHQTNEEPTSPGVIEFAPHLEPLPLLPGPSDSGPQQNAPPQSSNPDEPEFVVINGIRTRKRRANTTEIELVASVLGSTLPAPQRTYLNAKAPRRMYLPQVQNISTWVMAGVRNVVTRAGGKVAGFARTTTNHVARIRRRAGAAVNTARRTIEFSNKRFRVDAPDATLARWQPGEDAIRNIIIEKNEFFNFMNKLGRTIEQTGDREQMNHILRFLRSSVPLLPSSDPIADQNADLVERFLRQLLNCIQVCDRVYSIDSFIRLKKRNPTLQARISYDIKVEDLPHVRSARAFLAAPALPATCNDFLQLFGFNSSQRLPKDDFDAVLLDLQAILANLPMPTFVVSKRYRKQIRLYFPAPERSASDWKWTIPGAFPEDEPEPRGEDAVASQNAIVTEAVAEPVASLQPEIRRSDMSHVNRLRADYLEANIAKMTDAEFHAKYYNKSEAHCSIENQYVRSFESKEPCPSKHPLNSILKHRKKLPRQSTPKRLRVTRPPKIVRFTEGTLSPQQRSHTGLDVPRRLDQKRDSQLPVTPMPRRGATRNVFMRDEDAPQIELEIETPMKDVLPGRLNRRPREPADKTQKDSDPDARIRALFDEPSPPGMAKSEAVSKLVQRMKSDAVRKAAEDARLADEEKKKAQKAAREAAEVARKAEEEKRKAEEERRRREFIRNIDQHRQLRTPNKPLITVPTGPLVGKADSTLLGSGTQIFTTTPEGTGLRKHDFTSVIPDTNWLNDEIINGSILWLDRSINEAAGIKDFKQQTRKCLALTSFFFKSLLSKGNEGVERKMRRHGINKNNFLDMDTVLMPVCTNNHWTLIVIRPKMRTIAHMDSLNPAGNQHYIDVGMNYVRFVLKDNFEESLWKTESYQAPRQTNGYDCGVFTITNAICLALGLSPVEAYSARDMTVQRKRIACILLNEGYHGDFSLEGF